MAADLPKASIVMPNYNHGHLISEALACAVDQTVLPLEVIVIDDGSTDNSLAVIEAAARESSLIRVIRHHENLGVVAGMNRGLQEARGDFVLFTAADDCLDRNIVERSMTAAAQYPDVGLCFSDAGELLPSGDRRTRPLHLSDRTTRYSPAEMTGLLSKNPVAIPPASVFYHRSRLQEAGGFDPSLRWRADGFAVVAMSLRYGACYTPDAISYYRHLDDSYSSNAADWTVHRTVAQRWLAKFKDEEWSDIREAATTAMVLADYSLAGLWLAIREYSLSPAQISRLLPHVIWNVLRPIAPQPLRELGRRRRAANLRASLLRYMKRRQRDNDVGKL